MMVRLALRRGPGELLFGAGRALSAPPAAAGLAEAEGDCTAGSEPDDLDVGLGMGRDGVNLAGRAGRAALAGLAMVPGLEGLALTAGRLPELLDEAERAGAAGGETGAAGVAGADAAG
ncbi:MAG: hypothetical protein KC593_23440, partial [Myxococcales bacterium]|nr:hypothetical protein [Myxococcales bacterium]